MRNEKKLWLFVFYLLFYEKEIVYVYQFVKVRPHDFEFSGGNPHILPITNFLHSMIHLNVFAARLIDISGNIFGNCSRIVCGL